MQTEKVTEDSILVVPKKEYNNIIIELEAENMALKKQIEIYKKVLDEKQKNHNKHSLNNLSCISIIKTGDAQKNINGNSLNNNLSYDTLIKKDEKYQKNINNLSTKLKKKEPAYFKIKDNTNEYNFELCEKFNFYDRYELHHGVYLKKKKL